MRLLLGAVVMSLLALGCESGLGPIADTTGGYADGQPAADEGCPEGYALLGARCVRLEGPDAGASDEDLAGAADLGAADIEAPPPDAWRPPDSGGGTVEPVPQAPVLRVLHQGAVLPFSLAGAAPIEVGLGAPEDARPEIWHLADALALDTPGPMRVFARAAGEQRTEAWFAALYEVRESYPPAAGQEGSAALPLDDPRIVGWATGVAEVQFGEDVDEAWRSPERALGPAAGSSTDILCLGRGGWVTLRFDPPIVDGPGDDLAVFENSFSDTFLELAFVEVSSDGERFLRFDSVALHDEPVAAFGDLDPASLEGLAGKYRQGFGTPFDLGSLANRPEVRDGTVGLAAITHVRLVDVVGDGSAVDSFGNPIWDPYPTVGSAGFDLDGVAVLNH